MNGEMNARFWRLGTRAVVCGLVASLGWAAEPAAPGGRDTLVYKDGDRVFGRLLRQEAGVLVFKSERFGELRVPAADAVVIKEEKRPAVAAAVPAAPVPSAAPASPAAAPAKVAATAARVAADRDDEERVTIWDRFSPSVLTARVRNFFGPWHGRFSFSTEAVTDVAERENNSIETWVRRKWARDEVQINGRYDFSETNDVVTTDMVKLTNQ